MRRLSLACAVVLVSTSIIAMARQTSSSQQPVFKGAVDVVQLDVSVLDKDRKPVRGLTAKDFTILEDGKPQEVVAFTAFDVPDAVTPSVAWKRDVTPDVTTNDLSETRLFIIVMDDGTLQPNIFAINSAKKIARSVVDKLGPQDLAAVVFTRDNRNTQDFTSDHRKLLAAVDKFSVGTRDRGPTIKKLDIYYADASLNTLREVTNYMIDVPQRRKALVYIGQGVGVNFNPEPGSDASWVDTVKEIFRRAERSNVNIYTMDVCGLRATGSDGTCYPGKEVTYLQTMADNTGGHATINTNDFEPGINAMFVENSSYYLLGYQSANTKADGTFRRLEVTVDRPGVEVRTRKNYYAATPEKPKDAKAGPPPPDLTALAGLLPNAALPLQVTAAPFATPGASTTTVALTLGVHQPASSDPVTEQIDVLAKAFTPEGIERGSVTQRASVRLHPGSGPDDVSRYDVLSQIVLKPGRYELRLSAHSAAFDKRGSVYVDVDVPDFAKAPVSLSGVVMSVLPAPLAAPRDALDALVPVVPTSAREFTRTDRATAFLRVYESTKTSAAPASLAIHITDSAGAAAFDRTQTLSTDRFTAASGEASARIAAADVRLDVPLATLAPGDYLLTFEATLGKTSARRDVRFSVK